VRACISGALRYVDAEELADLRREVVDASLKRLLRLSKGVR